MYSNHRVMKRTEYEEDNLYLVEVFYNVEDDSVLGWTEKAYVWGLDLDEVRRSLNSMLEATDKPILDEADLLQRAEEIRAMGADPHELGIQQLGVWEVEGGL